MSSSIKPPLDHKVLFWVKHPGITVFNLRFRNVHAYTWTRSRSLELPSHPLTPITLKRYALREEVPLWWSCIATREGGHADRVVRSWLARRTRNAFEESLRKKGFDTNGRPLSGSGNKADMFGTAYLSVTRRAAKVSFVELVKQTDVAVSEMQRIWERGQGKPTNRQGERNGGQKKSQPTRPVRTALIGNQ